MHFPVSKQAYLFLAVASLLLVGLLVEATATAEDGAPTWDAEVVTRLAVELSETLQEGYAHSQKAPPQQTAFQQRERDAAQGLIRRARDSSVDYARRMKEGWSRSDSEPYFLLVVDQVKEMRATAGDAVPTESMKALLDRMDEIIDELKTRYASS